MNNNDNNNKNNRELMERDHPIPRSWLSIVTLKSDLFSTFEMFPIASINLFHFAAITQRMCVCVRVCLKPNMESVRYVDVLVAI